MGEVTSLRSVPEALIIGSLPQEAKLALRARGKTCEFAEGEYIFHRGDEGGWLLFIDEGKVEISLIALDGKKSILNHMESGDLLGEVALLDRQKRSADAITMECVKGIKVTRQSILDYLRKNPEACFTIIETLCDRVRNASNMFETRALTSAGARLARCLLRFGENWGESIQCGYLHINQPISQSMLGEFAGISRENVNRYLKSWTRQRLLEFHRNGIVLKDIAQLNDLAEF